MRTLLRMLWQAVLITSSIVMLIASTILMNDDPTPFAIILFCFTIIVLFVTICNTLFLLCVITDKVDNDEEDI